MPASVAIKKKFKFGNGFGVVADVTMDSSYPTNGEALTAQQFGLSVLDFVLPSPAAGYIFEFDHTNSKLKAFTPTSVSLAGTAGTADANNTLMKVSDTAIGVAGTGTAAAVNNEAAEVANTTDLSEVTVRVIAIGI